MTLLTRNTWRVLILAAVTAHYPMEGEDKSFDGFITSARGEAESVKAASERPVTVAAARGQARVLHETIHGTLRVIHRDFYREDERLPIPSLTLQAVFDALARKHNIQIRWLAASTPAMNVEHGPRDEFEKAAAKALTAGQEEFEQVENGVYRHVGVIVLSSQCLKCHLPNRTSTKDRAAGLVIAMPVRPD